MLNCTGFGRTLRGTHSMALLTVEFSFVDVSIWLLLLASGGLNDGMTS